MSKASRIEPLLNLAGLDAREAARLLAERLKDLTAKEEEVARLEIYLDEYRERLTDGERSMASDRWQNDRLFMTRLSEVIAAQQSALLGARNEHQEQMESWRRSHLFNKGMQRLFESYCRSELQDLERLEQEEADEGTMRRHRD